MSLKPQEEKPHKGNFRVNRKLPWKVPWTKIRTLLGVAVSATIPAWRQGYATAGTSPWHQQRTLLLQVRFIQLNCFSINNQPRMDFALLSPASSMYFPPSPKVPHRLRSQLKTPQPFLSEFKGGSLVV